MKTNITLVGSILLTEPEVTPSVQAAIPALLKSQLVNSVLGKNERTKKSTLISSNSLANKFIFERWGIRSSQRRKYRNLFSDVRKRCRNLFKFFIQKGQISTHLNGIIYEFGVFKFDEVRGNLILGFVPPRRYLNWRYVSDDN
ncbi:MAG: hypothetical protein ACFFEV_06135 [Candidatus Thorarchaeota archaeon]